MAAIAAEIPQKVAFVTAKAPTSPVDRSIALQDIGFRTIDSALTFVADRIAVPGDDPRIRHARSDDAKAVAAVAKSTFRYSRFHLDPQIADTTANDIKAAWARNYFSGARGEGMLVAVGPDDTAVGFVQLLRKAGGDLVIDLVAVSEAASRQGLASALIGRAAATGLDGTPPPSLTVGTQAANIASCRLYESLGFRLSQSSYVLHHHGRTAS